VANLMMTRIAVMGAGAVGCFFGGMLARAGAAVTLIARQQHVDAITRAGLRLESLQFDDYIPMTATTDIIGVRDADVVLVSVKTPDTESVAQAMAPHLRTDAVIMSLQNGVDNARRIRRHLRQQVAPAVVYVAAEMTGPGHVRHKGRGDLIIGREHGRPPDDFRALESIAALFASADLPCRVSENVDVDLWVKLTTNCAFNGLSALTRMQYGPIVAASFGRTVLEPLVHEVVAVAQASGVPLGDAEMIEASYRLAAAMPGATSSTAQDIARGRRTEIDEFNGFVAQRGDELGIPTPVNRTVHALVKLLEGGRG
jgi:2-dehydropantoate 2-reductase